MFSKQSAERFEKDRLIEDPTPGPGAYHLPSAVDGKGAILEVSERWSESAEEEKLESNLSPLSPPFTRTPTPARGRDEKENRVPLSARCGSPRTWSTPATQPTPKKAATPGGWTPGPAVAPGCEDRRQRDLRLASKLDMVRDELRQKSKEAKELQLALTAKDRKIEDLSKKIEELAADRREAHRRTLEAENELGAKRRQLHEKEQEVVALQRKLEHARLARKEWSKHAEKREEEQRNMQNEMLRMQQSVENLQEKLVTSERDQQMAEQTLRQQQRHSSDLEAGFQAHIEVLEEQIARETCRRKDLEERQARDEAERARWDSALKGSERRCEELQGQVLKLEIELKSRVSSETSFTELRTKLEATSSSLQSSEASREELTRQVAKCSQQLQASNEELSSLKTQRAALEDELHRFGETQYLQLQQKVNEAEGQVKALTEDLSKERQQNQGLERKVVDLQDKSTQDVESQRRDRARVEEAEKQLKVLTEELAKEKHQKQALERKVVEVEEKSAYATVERERKERARVEEVEKQVKELTEDLAEERARNEVMERKLNDLEEQERSTRATLETERQERIRDTEICDLEARALRAEAEAEEARQMVERWKEWGDEQQLRELAAETERLERLKQVREDVSQQVEAARRELVAENRNCSDGAALQCRKSCPLFCFEGGPGLPGCDCRDECMKLVGCMARSKDDPDDVNSSEAVQCEAKTLRQSKEMKAFDDCALANVTYSNRWTSLSQTYRCLCSGHLQQELHSQNCCGSSSNQSRPFCEANCSVDCSTPEALQCSQQCSLMCEGTKASQECNDQCLQSTGQCNQYKVCPVATPEFSYVCDDGKAPSSNGCCKGVFDNDRCPLLCEVQWKTSNIWSAGSKRSSRCECSGCPSSVEESRKLMNETLLAVFERDATKQLIFILMTRGLHQLTSEMRGLFAMQMETVQWEISRYDGKGLLNWKLVHSSRDISSFYFQKLSQAADAEVESLKSSGAGAGMIWFALISCLCVISTIIIGCIIAKSLALQRRTQPVVVTPPTDTLVVGRPISSKDPPPEDAVQGVLVAEAAASR